MKDEDRQYPLVILKVIFANSVDPDQTALGAV